MKNVSLFQIVVSIGILALAGVSIFLFMDRPKIVYVRSYELIEKYQGTIEARSVFEKKKSALQSNVDSLRIDFERSKNQYLNAARSMTSAQHAQQEKTLSLQQSQLMRYSEAVEEKISEEDSKMMQEVLNQINSFVEEYAIKHQYTYVLGTTTDGNILFGDKAFDVTDQLVKDLNAHYKGK